MTIEITNGERSSIASEIRAHVKNMNTDERLQFLSHAHETGDIESLRSILGAPGFLSGISENERQIRTRMLHEKQSPEAVSQHGRSAAARASVDGGVRHGHPYMGVRAPCDPATDYSATSTRNAKRRGACA